MLSKRVVLPLLATGCVIVSAGPVRHHAHPPHHGGLPAFDYQYFEFSPTRRSLSELFIESRGDVRDDPLASRQIGTRAMAARPETDFSRRFRRYQFVKLPVLQIEHCALSEMAVSLHENGEWAVSFRAHQNPRLDAFAEAPDLLTLSPRAPLLDEGVTTLEPRKWQSSHILRNQFYVQLRMLSGNREGQRSLIGFPVVATLELDPFWVQREQVLPYHSYGKDSIIQAHFDEIDRVEIEFKYRRK